LQDNVDNPHLPSQYTWPALLAQHAQLEYVCNARGGSGNLHILEKLLRDVHKNPQDFYIIGWTWIDRFDYTDTKFDQNDHWYTLTPTNTSTVAKTYYKELHSEVRDKFASLTYINTAIDALNTAGSSYIMTCMDNLIFDNQWNAPDSTKYLQQRIVPHIMTFAGDTFLNFAKSNNHPISTTLHPLEKAHQQAEVLMRPVFNESRNK
jgi:hypothetical protein